MEILEDTKKPTVTLITCDQSGVSTQNRYMVQGTLINTTKLETTKTTILNEVKQDEKKQDENEYRKTYLNQTTTRTWGIYKLLLWLIGSGLLAAFLTYVGVKLLQKGEDKEQNEV
jgi:hypothetical protein